MTNSKFDDVAEVVKKVYDDRLGSIIVGLLNTFICLYAIFVIGMFSTRIWALGIIPGVMFVVNFFNVHNLITGRKAISIRSVKDEEDNHERT